MLEVNNVCVSFRSERQEKIFGTTRNQVLFDVSLKVSQGTCLGILGESGSGKSTLGRVICGLLKPDTGEVKIQDVSVYASRNGRKNLQKRLSVVFQDYTTSANPRFTSSTCNRTSSTYTHARVRPYLSSFSLPSSYSSSIVSADFKASHT